MSCNVIGSQCTLEGKMSRINMGTKEAKVILFEDMII